MPVKLYPFDPPLLEDCAVVDSAGVDPTQQSEIDKLKNRVKELELSAGRTTTVQQSPTGLSVVESKRQINWTLVLSVFTAVLALVGFVGGTLWIGHSELTRIDSRLSDTDKHIQRMEIAIKILGDAQGGNTKELVNDALTVAQMKNEFGDTQAAARILTMANKLIAQEKQKGEKAPHNFFQNAVANYGKIWDQSHGQGPAADEAFKGTLQLAEYRSALTPPPPDFHPKNQIKPASAGIALGHLEFRNGYALMADSLVFGPQRFSIDRYMMENVVFSGVTIIYDGGPIIMRNVRFVNCIFLVKASIGSNEFLRTAALGETSAKIPG